LIKRETAFKCKISDIINARYVKREGWEANYFDTSLGKISRINIIGVVVSKEEQVLVLDDGSGSIQLRNFENLDANIGELVLVIGRPRQYGDQTYIMPEIIKKTTPEWAKYRLLELKNHKPVVIEEKEENIEKKPSLSLADSILKKIAELDKGNGVRIDEILNHFKSGSADNTITQLIEEGEIFELKPGIVKMI